MSGTGNTYHMACQMKEIASPYMEDHKIVMIDKADAQNEATLSRATLVGVLFPTHGFMPPWSMIKFLLKMRRQNGIPALCAATRGGIKVGPLRIPGAAGLGTFLAAFLMMIKGYRPRAIFSLDMPSNFINFYKLMFFYFPSTTTVLPITLLFQPESPFQSSSRRFP